HLLQIFHASANQGADIFAKHEVNNRNGYSVGVHITAVHRHIILRFGQDFAPWPNVNKSWLQGSYLLFEIFTESLQGIGLIRKHEPHEIDGILASTHKILFLASQVVETGNKSMIHSAVVVDWLRARSLLQITQDRAISTPPEIAPNKATGIGNAVGKPRRP